MQDPQIYTVGWICAITTELVAAQSFLDEEHDDSQSAATNDNNTYVRGKIGNHNVVIALLPHGEYGTASAAIVARDMLRSFPNVRIGLMVGIGGGAPSPKHDIRLGDVVVSSRNGDKGGVFQYDFGKTIQNQAFQETGFLNQSPTVLRTAVGVLEAQYEMKCHNLEDSIKSALKRIRKRKKYSRPLLATDRPYRSDFEHPLSVDSCSEGCGDDPSRLVARDERDEDDDYPVIHHGLIASANQVMKDAIARDKLAAEKEVLCFEMEAAGLMNHFPCIVIRGICDYSDSHKNKEWQGFAAMVAAAYAKDLLLRVAADKVEEMQRAIDKLSLVHDDTQIIKNVVASLDTATSLNRLSIAEGASVELLEKLSVWITETSSKPIFWLNGMAGTGKSTIARTLAQTRVESNDLGATFFFKRGESDRTSLKNFVSTIARQLVKNVPGFDVHVKAAIDVDSTIVDKRVQDQFTRLIIEPLSKISKLQSSLVFVIDALDECEQDSDVALLIRLFSSTQGTSSRLRVFITSRPELPIRLGFKNIKGAYEDLILHEIPAPMIEHDITVFLRHKLNLIKKEADQFQGGRGLPQNWPGEAAVQKLVVMAVPLFIFASTICRLIGDYRLGNPQGLLDEVLSQENSGGASQLDMTYYPALKQQFSSLQDYQTDKLGTIITLFQPLSAASMSRLLDISEDAVADRLRLLHSVLNIPTDSDRPIRLLHLSFRDYLINFQSMKEKEFWIDEKLVHQNLVKHCLRIMRLHLREDICDLRHPGSQQSNIATERITRHVPIELEATSFESDIAEEVEVMSIIGRLTEVVPLLTNLEDWIQGVNEHLNQSLKDFVMDAIQSPLQIYSSALLYAPGRSFVRVQFADKIPKWISIRPMVESNWDPCLWVMSVAFSHNSKLLASGSQGECRQILKHRGTVTSVVFSHNSTLIASASHDKTVRIWSTETGECEQVLWHSDLVISVAFLHDSKLAVSASGDNSVCIWSTETGERKEILKRNGKSLKSVALSHGPDRIWNAETGEYKLPLSAYVQDNSVRSVALSEDFSLVALAYDKDTIRICRVDTDECTHILESHAGQALFMKFSPDSKLVAYFGRTGTAWIWNLDTGRCNVLEGPVNLVRGVTFSHDSKFVTIISAHIHIRIWSAHTGECKTTLEGHNSELLPVIFSHNSKLLAPTSAGSAIRIWSTNSGDSRDPKVHGDTVSSVALSHDSKLGASSSYDINTIRIWSIDTGEYRLLEGHSNPVLVVEFSHSSNLLASASLDDTVRIWNIDTGECIQLRFDANDTSLSTDNGTLPVDKMSGAVSSDPPSMVDSSTIADLAINEEMTWISWRREKILWLPTECRRGETAVRGSTIIIGCELGRVMLIRFCIEELDALIRNLSNRGIQA
ncbi:WD40-repeat-containing domain protein [Trichoderma austrokoningii]